MAFLSEPPLTGGAISQIDFCTFFYQWFWSGWEVLPSDNQEQEKCDGTTERLGFTAAGFVGVLEILWTLRTFDFLYWVLLIATCFTAACSIFWDVVILWTLRGCSLLLSPPRCLLWTLCMHRISLELKIRRTNIDEFPILVFAVVLWILSWSISGNPHQWLHWNSK